MANLNPYLNTANILVKEKRIGNTVAFLNKNVKDKNLLLTIYQIIEMGKHIAFNEGREQGKYEVSQTLKSLLDVENPEFEERIIEI